MMTGYLKKRRRILYNLIILKWYVRAIKMSPKGMKGLIRCTIHTFCRMQTMEYSINVCILQNQIKSLPACDSHSSY
jgi:hypothetical protein